MAAAKAASKSASEAANGDSVKTEMAVVDKGGGVVEMVPHDEDGQVRISRVCLSFNSIAWRVDL